MGCVNEGQDSTGRPNSGARTRLSDNPLAESLSRLNEVVAKPWAKAMAAQANALGDEFMRLRSETRAKRCPCGCGHTLGEVLGDGLINPHTLWPRRR
jgi:hypothetical protein